MSVRGMQGCSRILAVFLICTFALSLVFCFPAAADQATSAAAQATSAAAQTTSAAAQTAARRTVRIGLSDTDTLTASGEANRTDAFLEDYMRAVAEHAGWECEFVEAPWAECLEMVRTGEIDLLGDVSRTEERLAYYGYSSESMGTEMCYLYGRGDTTLRYDDPRDFEGLRVGYENGSTIIDVFGKYAKDRGFSFLPQPYESGAAMFSALDAGEVDAVVQTNFYDTPPGHVILAKCSPSPVYIVTAAGNTALLSELNFAMTKLFSYNPSFNSDLFEYYFGTGESRASRFTEEESAYLAAKPVVDVIYEKSWEPFEYERNGRAEGITPDLIRAIGEDTGIDFRFLLSSSTQSIYQGMGELSGDTVMAMSYDFGWADQHDLLVTQPYVTGSVMRISGRADAETETVACMEGGYLANRVRQAYPQLKQINYQTAEECMKAVRDGKADCTFLNYYQASYYRMESEFDSLYYQPEKNISQNIALGVTKESNPLLLGILSKALQRLPYNTMQGILNENSRRTEPLSFRTMMKRYPVQMAAGLGLLGIMTGLLVLLFMTASIRKRRNLELQASKSEAEAASRAKTDFLSRMSHDIRTPMNGIIGMTYLAKSENNPAQTADCLNKIETSSKFLLGLINDILDMSKAESGKIELHPEPYLMSEFENYIDSVIRPLCEEKNQIFSAETHPVPTAVPIVDTLRYNQIMFNILSNAVKYTPEGGKISFRVDNELVAGHKERITAEITDNGIGMDEAFLKVLFNPFTQGKRSDTAENRGSGLGLSIVKRLVDLMGGTISVKSRVGEGTTFTVTIDFDYIDAKQSDWEKNERTAAAADGEGLEGKHVLLCEDHPLNQEIVRKLLEEKKMIVEVAENGQEGVRRFSGSAAFYYDVILMDIRMPVMDGYEATRSIRALNRPDAKTVRILAMTADAFAEDVRKCLDAGMNGHIAKPVNPAELFRLLAEQTGGNGRA